MDELNDLLKNLPGYSLLTTTMKNTALQASRIPDSAGVWPGEDDYEDTYDAYYAALSLLGFLQAQQHVTSAGSEGSSITVTKPDWSALSAYYRSMSAIMIANGNYVLNRVPIPDGPHVVHTNMNQGGGYYGDVDTDVN